MDRDELVNIMKEVKQNCPTLTDNAIMIMPSNSNNVVSSGSQLHIKGSVDSVTVNCIQNIAKRHNSAVNVEPDLQLVVIY